MDNFFQGISGDTGIVKTWASSWDYSWDLFVIASFSQTCIGVTTRKRGPFKTWKIILLKSSRGSFWPQSSLNYSLILWYFSVWPMGWEWYFKFRGSQNAIRCHHEKRCVELLQREWELAIYLHPFTLMNCILWGKNWSYESVTEGICSDQFFHNFQEWDVELYVSHA